MNNSKIEKMNFSCHRASCCGSSSQLNSTGIQFFSQGDIENRSGNPCIIYNVLKNLTTKETFDYR